MSPFIHKIAVFRVLILLAIYAVAADSAKAGTINVNSTSALQTAISGAASGDVIILANGTYSNTTLNIGKSNITVRAETPGGVFLNGTNDINLNGSFIVFSGFQFTSGNIGLSYLIEVYGSNNKLTQLNFSGYFSKKYIEIKGGTQYNEISYCNLEKKPAAAEPGCTIQISTSATVPGYHKIRYCSFQNYYGLGGDNGNEPIRIGLGAEALNQSRTVVEYCYFNNTGDGDSESISIKSRENTVRYCTFTNQQNAMLVFRYGDYNVAYGNFFINAGGIRVKEANHIYCYNNYFENAGTGGSADAINFVYISPNLYNINFLHNTFVNCGFIDLGNTGPTGNIWANNLFKRTSGNIFKNLNSGTSWAGNLYQGSPGITVSSGLTGANLQLAANGAGYQGLTASSPALDASSNGYSPIFDIPGIDDDPGLLLDLSGRQRPASAGLKDVGCEEYDGAPTSVVNTPLLLSQVGPSYLGGPVMPVKLVNFDAVAQNHQARLSWATAFEQNSSHFLVQRSHNGFDFTTIAKIDAQANSSGIKNYSFMDMTPLPGVNYYRLKQTDLDGRSGYSAITKLVFLNNQGVDIFPNPANQQIGLRFLLPPAGLVRTSVYNAAGRLIKVYAPVQPQGSSQGIFTYNSAGLANGIYFLEISAAGFSTRVKVRIER